MTEQMEYQHLPSFLLGESMGGAIALKIHFKQPTAWDGAALIAPLCKVSPWIFKPQLKLIDCLIYIFVSKLTNFLEQFGDDMIPHWLLKQILIGVAKVLPKTKLVPQKEEVKENIYRDMKKRKLVSVGANKHITAMFGFPFYGLETQFSQWNILVCVCLRFWTPSTSVCSEHNQFYNCFSQIQLFEFVQCTLNRQPTKHNLPHAWNAGNNPCLFSSI